MASMPWATAAATMPSISRYDANRLAFFADEIGLVGLEAVQRVAIFVRIDGDGANAQLVGGSKHADRNFAAIGDQELPNCLHASASKRWQAPSFSRVAPNMLH